MSEMTHRLGLPLIAAGQAQKHVPVNEALVRLDLLVQSAVESRTLNVPPVGAVDGSRYLVASGGVAEWTGHDGQLAVLDAGGWSFLEPRQGWLVWVVAEQMLCVFDADGWKQTASGAGAQNLTRFGFGAVADAASPFVVKADTVLWTGRSQDEGGGDLRSVMNKAASGNVVSLLMQDAYSGRAEIGLIGDDDFCFKVSADGMVWREAIKIDRQTGRPRFPQGGVREQLAGDAIFFVRADGADSHDGYNDKPSGAFLTLQRAYDVVSERFDLAGHTVTIRLGVGAFAGLHVINGWTGGGSIVIEGAGTEASVLEDADHLIAWSAPLPGELRICNVALRTSGTADAIHGAAGGRLVFKDVVFGACGGRHIAALAPGARIVCAGDYAITGSAASHWSAAHASSIDVRGRAITLAREPVFTVFAEAQSGGIIEAGGNSFNGTAKGPCYRVASNGVISTGNGGGYLPGDTGGTLSSGGQYV